MRYGRLQDGAEIQRTEGGDLHHIRRLHAFVPGVFAPLEMPEENAMNDGESAQ